MESFFYRLGPRSISRLLLHGGGIALVLALAGVSSGLAQPKRFRPAPEYVQLSRPDQEEGRRILEEFRQRSRLEGYYLEFQLRVMPRRGEERVVAGRLWGEGTGEGPTSRIVLLPGQGRNERRLLVRSGGEAAGWLWNASEPDRVTSLQAEALWVSLEETELTPFDVQMPFLYWPDFVFEGVVRLRGRPAHAFLFYPPEALAAKRPELSGVRVFLDTQYSALVQAEQLDVQGKPAKVMTVLDFKKVGDHWIVKTIDLRNEATRDKTRFSVTAAAVAEAFAARLFDPESLVESVRPPPADRIVPVGP